MCVGDAVEVPSRFDVARGTISHTPSTKMNGARAGCLRRERALTQSLLFVATFDRRELQGGEQGQQAEALRGDLHGDRHIGVHLWQCVSMTSLASASSHGLVQSDRLAILR